MNNADKLLENFVNVKHKLAGRTLEPFCALHFLFLSHLASPFIETHKPVTAADVRIAAAVCSARTSEEIIANLARLRTRNKGLPRLRGYFARPMDLEAEISAFLAYQGDFLCLPAYGSGDGDESVSEEKIPWLFLAMAAVAKATGWNEQTIITMPLGKLLWYSSAFGYLATGKCNIIGEREAAAIAAMEALIGGGGLDSGKGGITNETKGE